MLRVTATLALAASAIVMSATGTHGFHARDTVHHGIHGRAATAGRQPSQTTLAAEGREPLMSAVMAAAAAVSKVSKMTSSVRATSGGAQPTRAPQPDSEDQASGPKRLIEYKFDYDDIPYRVNPYAVERGPQAGYNICNATTAGPDSRCQTAIINNMSDFCLWGASGKSGAHLGDVEGATVAYCLNPSRGARTLPFDALSGMQMVTTDKYIQIVGKIDITALGFAANDDGGELDPSGADGLGNPVGGLVYSSDLFAGDDLKQVRRWNLFYDSGMFCLKICNLNRKDPNLCLNTYDIIGCRYNMPSSFYDDKSMQNEFVECESDRQDVVGQYVGAKGATSTWSLPRPLPADATIPYEPRVPSSSNCKTYAKTELLARAAATTKPTGTKTQATGAAKATSLVTAKAASLGAAATTGITVSKAVQQPKASAATTSNSTRSSGNSTIHRQTARSRFSPGQPVQSLCIEGRPRRIRLKNPLGLPAPLTTRQLLYILGPQMIGAAVVDGLANFGIACAMYRTGADPISFWKLSESTVAGDLGVTVLIQVTLTFIIAGSMVHVDMRKGMIPAFPYPWPDTRFAVVDLGRPEDAKSRRGAIWRLFHQRHGIGRGLHFFSGSDVNDLFDFNVGFKRWIGRFVLTAIKGALLSALFFCVFWPIAIACLAPPYGGVNMAHSWTPPLIKLVFGFLLGLVSTPFVACIALGSEDAVRQHRREVHDKNVQEMEAAAPATNTFAEKSVRQPERAYF
ncbi:hypothetical protein OIO90_006034 [Microbotryomycetes sp. JL221]|nr:hypothetical protein OIO90_006034 [Microbotryomycetes sp. JL221]